jgi:hypothetical protein
VPSSFSIVDGHQYFGRTQYPHLPQFDLGSRTFRNVATRLGGYNPENQNLILHGLLGLNFVTKSYKLVRSWNRQWYEQDRDRRALSNHPITFLALRRTPIWQLTYRIQLKHLSGYTSVFMDIYAHKYVHRFHLEWWIESYWQNTFYMFNHDISCRFWLKIKQCWGFEGGKGTHAITQRSGLRVNAKEWRNLY